MCDGAQIPGREGGNVRGMVKLNPSETLAEYERAALGLLTQANKGVLDRTARLLASYVAYYQLRHGVIPVGALVDVSSTTASTGQAAARAETLRVLAATLTLATAVTMAPPQQRRKKRLIKRSRS